MQKHIEINLPVIILLGPTGVGKTGLSILLAKALNTEIISADSMQIYQHMVIGTAKPSLLERRTVKHHLINILSPAESFSAGLFRDRAVKIIDDLHRNGKVPVIVGGTGLYIKTLTRGLFDGPVADWKLREEFIQEEQRFGKGHLYNRLREIDPASAYKINPNDTRRIIRALEVCLKQRKTMTESQSETFPCPYGFIKIGLSRDRAEIYQLIDKRVDRMMDDGLLEETKKLLEMHPSRIPLQALGYKEMGLYLNSSVTLEEAVRLLKKRTRMYAKRQFTWFKKEPDIKWVDVTGFIEADRIFNKVVNDVEILKEFLYSKT